jgi:hypothetical protein
MGLLYHWRKENYEDDIIDCATEPFWLSQGNKLFRDVEYGEKIWAFSRRNDGSYVLVAACEAKCVDEKVGYKLGKYFVNAIDGSAILYDPIDGEDIEPLIRSLPLSLKNPSLGRNFQGLAGVKKIPPECEEQLIQFADRQPQLT